MSVVDGFGESREIGAGFGTMGNKIGYFALRVGTVGVIFAAMAFLASIAPVPRLKKHAAVLPVAVQRRTRLAKYGPEIVKPEEDTAVAVGRVMRIIRLVLLVSRPAMAIFVVASAEWYFQRLAPNVPSVEKMESVGQWGVWAATAVVLIATVANAMMDKAGLAVHDDSLTMLLFNVTMLSRSDVRCCSYTNVATYRRKYVQEYPFAYIFKSKSTLRTDPSRVFSKSVGTFSK